MVFIFGDFRFSTWEQAHDDEGFLVGVVLLVCCKFVNLTLKYGIAPESSYGFAVYALVLIAFGKIEEGYKYGELSLDLVEPY